MTNDNSIIKSSLVCKYCGSDEGTRYTWPSVFIGKDLTKASVLDEIPVVCDDCND